ncbi:MULTISPECIES: CesT family type III secretion system chaperone [unclassified Pseudomonas]|uniref:CesT family type III secretion system chaperone n=1 Tax=unclassified Pseudomonas TaxID=196821 RepID=UPI001E60F82F|nr:MULTISPECIES: CesT family type III secretion system chaperone [unclassified Pseudomonas]MDC0690365.1 CesT family type III secretion system chaperone [Mitsuaria sp. RG]MCE0917185.1 CesT family type III secretion system chaperone [Pseudomonas sp. NMI760_13]MCF1490537.1 CesT family type III secretion system chaperone [Pseudomonas sp. AA27]MCP8635506.1 CesT family type III secretion system chaperone [Pseudomonas sp. DVZ6]MDD7786987.1 CesT family type III secretion system chaperone [Pseudomonas 
MPGTNYDYALTQLYAALKLDPPVAFEPVISLRVGTHVCNVTEHPADQLLMFIELPAIDDVRWGQQNLFCQDACKPVLGLDPITGCQVLWNRQSLMQMDRAMVHHQLEQLVQAAHDLADGETP